MHGGSGTAVASRAMGALEPVVTANRACWEVVWLPRWVSVGRGARVRREVLRQEPEGLEEACWRAKAELENVLGHEAIQSGVASEVATDARRLVRAITSIRKLASVK